MNFAWCITIIAALIGSLLNATRELRKCVSIFSEVQYHVVVVAVFGSRFARLHQIDRKPVIHIFLCHNVAAKRGLAERAARAQYKNVISVQVIDWTFDNLAHKYTGILVAINFIFRLKIAPIGDYKNFV